MTLPRRIFLHAADYRLRTTPLASRRERSDGVAGELQATLAEEK